LEDPLLNPSPPCGRRRTGEMCSYILLYKERCPLSSFIRRRRIASPNPPPPSGRGRKKVGEGERY